MIALFLQWTYNRVMATNAEIFEVRLRVDDPFGFIAIESVANSSALPSTPAVQTVYKLADTGAYVATDLSEGATCADYEVQEVRVSDTRISGWIDASGSDYATCQVLRQIIAKLGREIVIKKSNAGAEDLEWTSLADMKKYYQEILNQCKETKRSNNNNSTGRWGGSYAPTIAGGNV